MFHKSRAPLNPLTRVHLKNQSPREVCTHAATVSVERYAAMADSLVTNASQGIYRQDASTPNRSNVLCLQKGLHFTRFDKTCAVRDVNLTIVTEHLKACPKASKNVTPF